MKRPFSRSIFRAGLMLVLLGLALAGVWDPGSALAQCAM